MRAWCGVDPGSNGSAVLISESGSVHVCRFGNSTEQEIWRFLSGFIFEYTITAILEKVWAMPATNPDGTQRGMGAQTSFVFGEKFGMIKAFLVAAEIPFEQKVPQTWQKFYGMKRDKNESQTDYKRRLKEKAQSLYPHVKVTNDVADALLIAHYCMKTT